MEKNSDEKTDNAVFQFLWDTAEAAENGVNVYVYASGCGTYKVNVTEDFNVNFLTIDKEPESKPIDFLTQLSDNNAKKHFIYEFDKYVRFQNRLTTQPIKVNFWYDKVTDLDWPDNEVFETYLITYSYNGGTEKHSVICLWNRYEYTLQSVTEMFVYSTVALF